MCARKEFLTEPAKALAMAALNFAMAPQIRRKHPRRKESPKRLILGLWLQFNNCCGACMWVRCWRCLHGDRLASTGRLHLRYTPVGASPSRRRPFVGSSTLRQSRYMYIHIYTYIYIRGLQDLEQAWDPRWGCGLGWSTSQHLNNNVDKVVQSGANRHLETCPCNLQGQPLEQSMRRDTPTADEHMTCVHAWRLAALWRGCRWLGGVAA